MLNRIRQLAASVSKFATPEDIDTVAAANSAEFIDIQTGMTREQLRTVFGEFDPNTICKLHILAGKKAPSNPEEWQKFAQEFEETKKKVLGE